MLSRDAIAAAVREVSDFAVGLRRRLHQRPELAYEEHETAGLIREELRRLGISFEVGPADAPTATLALIGDRAKPCVALRADIDALPITEATGLPYASTRPGCMHACGHDGHTAGLLGAAAVLKRFEAELPCCVLCIFQPAEELGNVGGAERLVKAGVLDGAIGGAKPQSIFALHAWASVPVGRIATRPGPIMASVDNFRATFRGIGGHGAYPHLGRDPIVAVAEAVLSLQSIVSREIDPLDSAVVTVGAISGGTAANVIPETASIDGTVRSLTAATRQQLGQAVRRRLEGVAQACGVTLELEWLAGFPSTVNDPGMAEYVREVTRAAFGAEAFIPAPWPSMGGEDFAYYLQKVPGCFIQLGIRPAGVTDFPNGHNPRFNFNDESMPYAIRLLVELAVGRTPR